MRKFIILLLITSSLNSFSQAWTNDDSEKALFISDLHYATFNDLTKGFDSAYYLFTQHQPEDYWKKKNRNKGELLVSRIDTNGNISFIKKLDTHSEKVYKALFNDKYYLLDMEVIEISGKYVYKGYVYNSKWELERTFLIPELTKQHQRGYPKFVVDKNENIYLFSSAYYIDHKPQDFTGTYLVKCDKEGNIVNQLFYDKSEISNIELLETGIFVKVLKEKFVYPFYSTDSILKVEVNFDLVPTKQEAQKYSPYEIERKMKSTTILKTGDKVIMYDSSYSVGIDATQFVNKIAYYNSNGKRLWGYQIPLSHNYSTPRALKNGNFILKLEKNNSQEAIYDTISFVQFDKFGNQKIIKTFFDGAKPKIPRYLISYYYFEGRENEIWLFYQKSEDAKVEKIYFIKLPIT
jgi:hypothetical protein